jgi:3-dehydroquinate dehydratase II
VRIDILNGVNLDILGRRDPATYGQESLQDLETQIYAWARALALQVRCRQTNHEGEYVEFLHAALDGADALVLNPAAWTHYSWAIRDAVETFAGPVIEVHLSNVDEREEWRRHSVLDGLVTARVVGKGIEGYREALELLASRDEVAQETAT